MSVGPLIASGIGVLLLVFTAYILIGGTLATTEVMVEAQSNLAANQEVRMRTAIAIQNTTVGDGILYVEVENTGSEPIVDIAAMDVYVYSDGIPAYIPPENRSKVSIIPDVVHPGELDPGETLNLSVAVAGESPGYVQVVTPNGVSGSARV